MIFMHTSKFENNLIKVKKIHIKHWKSAEFSETSSCNNFMEKNEIEINLFSQLLYALLAF